VAALVDTDILANKLDFYEAKPFGEISDDDWLCMIEVNVMSGVRLSRHYFPGCSRRSEEVGAPMSASACAWQVCSDPCSRRNAEQQR
jgi:NAD(P)-dependent dehydrogenase (short-subunit alcohol dehydrogenase family)